MGSGSVIHTKRRRARNVGRSLSAGGRLCFRGVQVRQGCGVTVGEAGEADKRAKGRRGTNEVADSGEKGVGRVRRIRGLRVGG